MRREDVMEKHQRWSLPLRPECSFFGVVPFFGGLVMDCLCVFDKRRLLRLLLIEWAF